MIQTECAYDAPREADGPNCPLGGNSHSIRLAFERQGIAIYSCGCCALEFQFPQPSDDELAAIYSSGYFLGSGDAALLANQRALKRATARLYLEQISRSLPAGGRLLEIGCGHGEFLIEAQALGFEVEGLEYSAHAASEANAQLGRSAVRVGSPEVDRFPAETYDLVAAFDVVEHLRRPVEALSRLRRALRPGGSIAIATPSLDSWSRRLLGRYWMEYKTEHLTYFSRKSLRRMLQVGGFEAIRFEPNYKILNLEYIAGHFERFPVPILTPLVRIVNRTVPRRLVRHPVRVVASGVMAVARKSE